MSITSEAWTAADIGDQAGRTAVITGASSGVGFETARLLAEHGAGVVLACRNLGKAREAAARIGAGAEIVHLDLTSLASIRVVARELPPTIDLLVNNAGVMRAPYTRTADGFELHLGTNHLGHFALTGLLLDRMLATPGSRIVTVSSPAHREGRIDFDDLQLERKYRRGAAYARSKLANLLFTYELQRRLEAAGAETIALAAHPGGARTELNRHLPLPFRGRSWRLARPITHRADIGALSILRAAVDPAARGAEYYAPAGRAEFKGHPARRESNVHSHDAGAQHRLWAISEELTGVTYPI